MMRMGVSLLLGLAFDPGVQRVERGDFGRREGDARRLGAAVAGLDQLQDDAGGLGGDGGQFHQPVGGFELAVLHPQPVRFHQAEQLLNIPFTTPLIN